MTPLQHEPSASPSGSSPTRTSLLEGIADAEPGPDARYEARETLELAFIAALQHLPPRQRAALVLRDVLGFHAAEAGDILDSSVDSVKAALKRARATLEQRLPLTDRERSPLPRLSPTSASSCNGSQTPSRPTTSTASSAPDRGCIAHDAAFDARIPGPTGDRVVPAREHDLAPRSALPVATDTREHAARIRDLIAPTHTHRSPTPRDWSS